MEGKRDSERWQKGFLWNGKGSDQLGQGAYGSSGFMGTH